MDNNNTPLENVNKKSNKKVVFIIIGALVVVGLGIGGYFAYNLISTQNNDLTGLRTNTTKLDKDNQSLATKNANLEKIVKALQNQLNSEGPNSSDNQDESTETAVAKIVVNTVKDQPGSDFVLPGKPQINGNLRAVYVTLTNLTDTSQTYDHFQFEAILNTGVIVKPRVYSPQESTVWNSSKLAAGASQDIILLFGTDENLVTLSWTPTGARSPIIVTVPVAIPLSA